MKLRRNTDMILDTKKLDQKIVKCCRCGRKIQRKDAVEIDGRLYCRKCGEDEKGWRFIEMMESIK